MMDESFRNMSARTRSFQQRNTLKLAHIVFSPASIRKRPAHMETSRGNPFWCNAFLTVTTHHVILFVSLLLVSHCFFCVAFSQRLRDSWRLMQRASTKPGAFDLPFRSVSASKNFHLNLTMKSKEKLLPNWSSFAKNSQQHRSRAEARATSPRSFLCSLHCTDLQKHSQSEYLLRNQP